MTSNDHDPLFLYEYSHQQVCKYKHHLLFKAKLHDQLFLLLIHYQHLLIMVDLNYFLCKSKALNQGQLENENNCLLYHFKVCRMKTLFFVSGRQEC